jgi:transcriptional regulator with XRE-family HTH domain
MSRLSEIVKSIRFEGGLTVRALADLAGTSAPTISNYEHGKREPMLSTIERLADAAGFDVEVTLHRRLSRSDRIKLAYHEAIDRKLQRDPDSVIGTARRFLDLLRSVNRNSGSDVYFERWESLLDGPVEQLHETLTSRAQHAVDLRNVSPFAGVLDQAERQEILEREWALSDAP